MPMETEEILDYARRITSRSVVEASLRKLNIINDEMPIEKQEDITERVTTRLVSAKVTLKSNIVKLSVIYNNSMMAAKLANTIFETFEKLNREEKNMQQHNVSAFLETALEKTSNKLKEEEEKIRALTSLGVVGMADNMLEKIDELDKKRGDLLNFYTENYPEVVAITDQANEIKADLKKLPKEEFEYSTIKRDLGIDRRLYNSLKQKLQEAQIKEAETINNITLVDKAIPPRIPNYPRKITIVLLGIVMGILLGVSGAVFFEQVVETSLSRVEDIEALLKVSILGIIPYCAEASSGEKRGDKEGFSFKKWFKKNQPVNNTMSHLIALQQESSMLEEAFRILGTNTQIVLGKGGRIKNKLIMVASSIPKEGKSFVSSNLAIILSQMGYQTLLIDTDLRLPTISKIFGLTDNSAGFSDLLSGTYKLSQLKTDVIKTPTDLMLGKFGADKIIANPWLNNLHIMTAGSMAPNPMNLFSSDITKEVLTYCQNEYDVVIIDSGPILTVSDPSILLPMMDGVLLVYRVGTTTRISLRRAKATIDSIRGPDGVTGLVLNSVVNKLSMNSHYAYYQGYYGKEEKRREPPRSGGAK